MYIPLSLICILLLFSACTKDNSANGSTKTETARIENFTFEELDGGITIKRYTGSEKAVVIPESINNVPVTNIGANAFFGNDSLASVVLPNSITCIGINAFTNCKSLTTIAFPENLEEIEGGAFANCENLSDLTLPNSVKMIGAQAFLNCKSLKKVTIPKDCILGIEAFYNSGLENISLALGITRIPDTCFAGTNIKTLVLPQTITKIERQAFANCKKLKTVSLSEGLVTIGDLAFSNTNLKEIIIPSTVTEIKETTFNNCSNLDKLKFEGNAPDNFLFVLQGHYLGAENVHFTIFYHTNAIGFTSPEWNGYPTKIW